MQQTIFTVGHSTHKLEHFFFLLKLHGVTALCDVRSKPYSRTNPQFNREDLKTALSDQITSGAPCSVILVVAAPKHLPSVSSP